MIINSPFQPCDFPPDLPLDKSCKTSAIPRQATVGDNRVLGTT